MAKREVLGTMTCPECGKTGAEVKKQKGGLLYRWCPECNAQYFPRTEETSERLGRAAGIGARQEAPVTDTEQKQPVTAPPATAQKARPGFTLGGL